MAAAAALLKQNTFLIFLRQNLFAAAQEYQLPHALSSRRFFRRRLIWTARTNYHLHPHHKIQKQIQMQIQMQMQTQTIANTNAAQEYKLL